MIDFSKTRGIHKASASGATSLVVIDGVSYVFAFAMAVKGMDCEDAIMITEYGVVSDLLGKAISVTIDLKEVF